MKTKCRLQIFVNLLPVNISDIRPLALGLKSEQMTVAGGGRPR